MFIFIFQKNFKLSAKIGGDIRNLPGSPGSGIIAFPLRIFPLHELDERHCPGKVCLWGSSHLLRDKRGLKSYDGLCGKLFVCRSPGVGRHSVVTKSYLYGSPLFTLTCDNTFPKLVPRIASLERRDTTAQAEAGYQTRSSRFHACAHSPTRRHTPPGWHRYTCLIQTALLSFDRPSQETVRIDNGTTNSSQNKKDAFHKQ